MYFDCFDNPKAKWRVTKSWIEDGPDKPKDMDITGPRNCPDDAEDGDFTWTKFRMYDDDGTLCYEGRMNEHCDGFEPLDHFGMPNAGCTELREWVPGKGGGWKTL